MVTGPPAVQRAAFLDAFVSIPPKAGSTLPLLLCSTARCCFLLFKVRRYDPSVHAEGAALVGDVSSFATVENEDGGQPADSGLCPVMNDQVVALLISFGRPMDAIDCSGVLDIEAYVPFRRTARGPRPF